MSCMILKDTVTTCIGESYVNLIHQQMKTRSGSTVQLYLQDFVGRHNKSTFSRDDLSLAGVGGVSRTELSFLTLRQQKNATFFADYYHPLTSCNYEMGIYVSVLSK